MGRGEGVAAGFGVEVRVGFGVCVAAGLAVGVCVGCCVCSGLGVFANRKPHIPTPGHRPGTSRAAATCC